MKRVAIFFISLYQIVLSPLLHLFLGQKNICWYEVSCSSYAKQMIEKYGIITGSRRALRRFLSCQPFAKPYGQSL